MKLRQTAPTIAGIREDHTARYQWAADQIREKRCRTVIDVGCGVGYGSWLIANECPGVRVRAVEKDQDTLLFAAVHYNVPGRIVFEHTDLADLSVADVDALTMFEVIEHTRAAPDFLTRVARRARYLFGSVPNEDIVPFARGGWNTEHYRHYTVAQITDELRVAGWAVTDMRSQHGKRGDGAQLARNQKGRTLVFAARSFRCE